MKFALSAMGRGAMIVLFLVAPSPIALMAAEAQPKEAEAPKEVFPRLVSTEWLEKNLLNEDVRIIDIREKVNGYWQGHIPGAVYLHPEALKASENGVPEILIPPEALAIVLARMGVSEKTTVIVYSEKDDFRAPYLVWALDYIGHSKAAMLDGGFAAWQKEKRPATQDYPQVKAAKYRPISKPDESVRARLDDVKEAVEKGSAVLIDVRPLDLYKGERGDWKRKGHIRGAVFRFWGDDQNEEGVWKGKEELAKAYGMIGATPDREIIVSCGQGQMAAHTYFLLKYIMGYPKVRLYDGGFSEWSNRDDLPIETGLRLELKAS